MGGRCRQCWRLRPCMRCPRLLASSWDACYGWIAKTAASNVLSQSMRMWHTTAVRRADIGSSAGRQAARCRQQGASPASSSWSWASLVAIMIADWKMGQAYRILLGNMSLITRPRRCAGWRWRCHLCLGSAMLLSICSQTNIHVAADSRRAEAGAGGGAVPPGAAAQPSCRVGGSNRHR